MTKQETLSEIFKFLRPCNRRGTGTLDLLVAFTLLVAAISVATPLVVRHGRLLKSHRNYRLALDELSNHLDRLQTLPIGELPQAVKQISLSSFVAERLPEAQLSGDVQRLNDAARITLKLSWSEVDRDRAPVTLVAWVFSAPARPNDKPPEAKSP
jgi:hypothetical protein